VRSDDLFSDSHSVLFVSRAGGASLSAQVRHPKR
jgi:hypothetical protein